jgi:hypothetical protein
MHSFESGDDDDDDNGSCGHGFVCDFCVGAFGMLVAGANAHP